ncbi:pirin family protein [Curvibacter sp. HBC61]|uniref:Pirin family protein n=1 Tax=Curvibacter cyanobacteriorum TaxID=3026422 RepID=A0ABT5MZP3_9BURK|nr:pirin family protein [Curvibacter sp. HBC61]MDD0839547.1 pirin family protein [Curvibacter sp. HBC61]
MTPSPPPPALQRPRTIERLVKGQATQDGAGVQLSRVLTQDLQRRLDPYLMLDHFASDQPDDYIAGFPNHPHRGFETVTYMIAGRMRHRDSAGHEGLLQNGGVQWMTAGRGLIHSELPEQEEGLMEGFQLWLNLPGRNKLCDPGYRDIQSEEIPEFDTAEGVRVRVIAGHSHGVAGAMQRDTTEPLYLDLSLPPGSRFEQPLPSTHNAFVYPFRESVAIEGQAVPPLQMAILRNTVLATSEGHDGVALSAPASNTAPARVLLIAGQPLREGIAQYGPFVMNTQEEVFQAIRDFQAGLMA